MPTPLAPRNAMPDAPEPKDGKEDGLQEAFRRFRERRIAERKSAKQAKAQAMAEVPPKGTPEFKQFLRRKFCETCKSYVGVAYGQRYHAPENCECEGCVEAGRKLYDSELFLDCCALVRRAVSDLQALFGFKLGPGNQVYQLDTLPIRKETVADLEPGDLIFYFGRYYSETAKPQLDNVVHVEVFLGTELGTGPESVVGSRFGKRTVTVYDSYQFVSKKWELLGYAFASIDTWLDGTLSNFHPSREWRHGRLVGSDDGGDGRYSLFAASDDEAGDPADA